MSNVVCLIFKFTSSSFTLKEATLLAKLFYEQFVSSLQLQISIVEMTCNVD